jgi:hypothetical protein
MCSKHYHRLTRNGDVSVTKRLARYTDPCKAHDCDRKAKANGYCTGHNARFKADWVVVDSTPLGVMSSAPKEPCTVDDCEKPRYFRNAPYCAMHTKRLAMTGALDKPTRYRKDGVGYINAEGYRVMSVNGVARKEHSLVMEAPGPPPR